MRLGMGFIKKLKEMQELNDFKMVVEKTSTGFSAYSLDYPVFTTGKNMNELLENSFEAANMYLEETGESLEKSRISFELNLEQFFKYYRVINANYLADVIGMNPTLLSQYVSGKKKPSAQQTKRIVEGINKIGRELSAIELR